MTQTTHTSLYRKYRPQVFKEVIGQDHIVKVLESAIATKKPHHAYLFTGTRGVGKTSIARIFAKALEVEVEDVYEIDAASYTGVDNIRELTEGAMTLPFRSPYKVFILDEVHMLSKAAFNAFLKGLEEPPAHVIYILATTELAKLPETIVSRCEVHTFRTPTTDTLTQIISSTAKKEGVTLADESLKVIALAGGGSFRDSLGVLQKVINASAGKNISLKEVEDIVGVPASDLIEDLVTCALEGKDATNVIDTIRSAHTDGKIMYDLYLETLRGKLRSSTVTTLQKEKIVQLLAKGLESYRHLRFVDPLMMLEVIL